MIEDKCLIESKKKTKKLKQTEKQQQQQQHTSTEVLTMNPLTPCLTSRSGTISAIPDRDPTPALYVITGLEPPRKGSP